MSGTAFSATFNSFEQKVQDQAARSLGTTGPVKRVVGQELTFMTFTTFNDILRVLKEAPRLKTFLVVPAGAGKRCQAIVMPAGAGRRCQAIVMPAGAERRCQAIVMPARAGRRCLGLVMPLRSRKRCLGLVMPLSTRAVVSSPRYVQHARTAGVSSPRYVPGKKETQRGDDTY